MGALFAKLLGAFWSKNMEVAIIGLQNAGKTTLVNVLADGVSPGTCESGPASSPGPGTYTAYTTANTTHTPQTPSLPSA